MRRVYRIGAWSTERIRRAGAAENAGSGMYRRHTACVQSRRRKYHKFAMITDRRYTYDMDLKRRIDRMKQQACGQDRNAQLSPGSPARGQFQ